MLVLIRLGLRNLQRNFRRSLITVCSIGFGLSFILWLQAILNGSNASVVETITSTYHGHLQIFRKDYLADKMAQQFFVWSEDTLPQVPGTQIFAAPRVHMPALVSSGEQSVPIMLEGIDPEREPQVTRIKNSLAEGEFLEPEKNGECGHYAYISKTLAKLLNVGLGEKIVVLAQATDGSMGNDLFRVKGLFSSGSPEYDKGVVISTIPCVQAVGVLGGVHEVALRVKGKATPEKIQELLRPRLKDNETVLSWAEVNPRLATITKMNDANLIIVSVILFIVISLGIVNTFLVTVFERTKEFGVMMALGTSRRGIIGTVLCEAFFLGVSASLLGILAASLMITYHSKVGFDLRPLVGANLAVGMFKLELLIYPVINWVGSAKATSLTVLVVMLSVLYPAIRASRLKPAAAIRSQ